METEASQILQEIQESNPFKSWKDLDLKQKMALAIEAATRTGFSYQHRCMVFDGYHKGLEGSLKGVAGDRGTMSQMCSVLLSGPTGVGKTGFLSAMFKRFFSVYAERNSKESGSLLPVKFGLKCLLITHMELSSLMFDHKPDKQTGLTDISTVKTSPLLIIDDLGEGGSSDYCVSILGAIIDFRARQLMPTWLSSNYSNEDMKKWPHWERICSRLRAYRYYEINGPDRRKR